MNEYIIAIDGGGTKTDVLCADAAGVVVGTGTSGPTNLTSTSVGAASFNLAEAIRQSVEHLDVAASRFPVVAMGLAGMDTEQEREVAQEVFRRALSAYTIDSFIVVNDSVIALENGSSAANAVVLISGTGSICYGRNASGDTAKAGGLDFLLTDQGSGYYIGRQVLREAVKSFDGRREHTMLEDLVCEHFRVASIAELKSHVYNPLLSKIEVAQLAKLCSVAHDRGDRVAQMIFSHALDELLLLLETVVDRLELRDQAFDLVFAGAVVRQPAINKPLLAACAQLFSHAQVLSAARPPVHGALKLGLRTLQNEQ